MIWSALRMLFASMYTLKLQPCLQAQGPRVRMKYGDSPWVDQGRIYQKCSWTDKLHLPGPLVHSENKKFPVRITSAMGRICDQTEKWMLLFDLQGLNLWECSDVWVWDFHLSKKTTVDGHGRFVNLISAVTSVFQVLPRLLWQAASGNAWNWQPPFLIWPLSNQPKGASPGGTHQLPLFCIPELCFLEAV